MVLLGFLRLKDMAVDVVPKRARLGGEGLEVGNWNAEVEGNAETMMAIVVAVVW